MFTQPPKAQKKPGHNLACVVEMKIIILGILAFVLLIGHTSTIVTALPQHTAYSNMDKQALAAAVAGNMTIVTQFCDKVNHIYPNGSTGPRTGTEIKICGNVPFDRSGILGGYLSALGK
jgi:hypothetical protein